MGTEHTHTLQGGDPIDTFLKRQKVGCHILRKSKAK